jgi:hypothetical protein
MHCCTRVSLQPVIPVMIYGACMLQRADWTHSRLGLLLAKVLADCC